MMRTSRSLPPNHHPVVEAVTGVAAMIREPRLRRTASTSGQLDESASYLGASDRAAVVLRKNQVDPTRGFCRESDPGW